MTFRTLLLLTWTLSSTDVAAQGVATGALLGPDDPQGLPWLGWTAIEASPFQAGMLEFHLPAGSFVADWEALTSRIHWAGWSLSERDWSTRVVSGLALPGVVKARWESTPFRLALESPWGVWVEQRWRELLVGGGRVEAHGEILAEDGFSLGPTHAEAWTLSGGFTFLAAFYGEAQADFTLERSTVFWWLQGRGGGESRWFGLQSEGQFDWGPSSWSGKAGALYAGGRVYTRVERGVVPQGLWATDEESRFRTIVGWWDQTWKDDRWLVGLTTVGGLVWVENPIWTEHHSWTEITFLPWPIPIPVLVDKTSRTQYSLEASPGWIVLVRPKLEWQPWRGVSLTWSRWIPLAGGFHQALGVDPDAPNPPASSSGGPTALSSWDFWMAGTQFELSAKW